jgi:uncharacterized membrane protein YhaH (DUF805 family)
LDWIRKEMLFGRRVTFALVILASHILLVALSITLFIELILIMKDGSINFVERNSTILIIEIILSALIGIFALVVFALQIKRLGERRKSDSGPRRVISNI